jgi:urease accessory protein
MFAHLFNRLKMAMADAIVPLSLVRIVRSVALVLGIVCSFWSILTLPAIAHHAMDGALPQNGLEGVLSGLAHPVIGLDHLAFVIAVGLLASLQPQGGWLPLVFLGTAVAGTGLHLAGWNLFASELMIATSVLLFGLMLAINIPDWRVVLGLGAFAGLFHGYAYGEAIVGAGMAPLLAYLLGFTVMQGAIAFGAMRLVKLISQKAMNASPSLRSVGFVMFGMGLAFLSNVLLA